MVLLLLLAGCGPRTTTAADAPDPSGGIVGKIETHQIEVLTHCGLEFLKFGDRTWRAETPLPEPKPRPDPNGVKYDGYTSGVVTVVDDKTLRFAVDDTRFEAPSEPVVFHPTDVEPPLCH
ncbi:hypothetical protein FKR81_06315 [Lentzea tibetensis]|uniref:Uncharacterized protein n=1 Tax=Lentzea tibetensis TaxID=2591470 RepID=A0A563F1E4_9PSEU|nr:hypothetical protein [Lentzea tibetensis]TWP53561.1 hypothetical protein FKR81_06315 [Lentzea tibetensis]